MLHVYRCNQRKVRGRGRKKKLERRRRRKEKKKICSMNRNI
jgi:hypothetical protein